MKQFMRKERDKTTSATLLRLYTVRLNLFRTQRLSSMRWSVENHWLILLAVNWARMVETDLRLETN